VQAETADEGHMRTTSTSKHDPSDSDNRVTTTGTTGDVAGGADAAHAVMAPLNRATVSRDAGVFDGEMNDDEWAEVIQSVEVCTTACIDLVRSLVRSGLNRHLTVLHALMESYDHREAHKSTSVCTAPHCTHTHTHARTHTRAHTHTHTHTHTQHTHTTQAPAGVGKAALEADDGDGAHAAEGGVPAWSDGDGDVPVAFSSGLAAIETVSSTGGDTSLQTEPQTLLHPHIAVHGMEGVPNFRDISSASPTCVRSGVFFRSGTPSAAT
jgi:hypothetical protein